MNVAFRTSPISAAVPELVAANPKNPLRACSAAVAISYSLGGPTAVREKVDAVEGPFFLVASEKVGLTLLLDVHIHPTQECAVEEVQGVDRALDLGLEASRAGTLAPDEQLERGPLNRGPFGELLKPARGDDGDLLVLGTRNESPEHDLPGRGTGSRADPLGAQAKADLLKQGHGASPC